MDNIIKTLDILLGFGIDIIIIISIVVLTQGIKQVFKCKSKTTFLIIVLTGLLIGIIKILIEPIEVSKYITVLFGYPGLSVLLYQGIKIYCYIKV
jgi:hypothetical protein